MSSEPYAVKAESVFVAMRDGVRISAHIHRPAGAGQFPAIVNYTPYRKGALRQGGHHPIVEHGYATVTFDIRGAGDSSGSNDSIYSAAERQDGYDMIEWAAAQEWCNGNVGIWGISFGAVVALQMAGAAPPSLKAVIARSGTDDPYTEWTNPGGSPRPYMYTCYAPIMSAANFSPPDPEALGERWEEVWAERLENNVPWGIPFIQNLRDGPFWRDRSLRDKYDQVQAAVFVVGGWADWYHTPLLRTFANLAGPKRALIGPWSHQFPDRGIPGPRLDWLGQALKWFDRWLKEIDNGVMDEPPISLFVREYSPPATILTVDQGGFQHEDQWPPAPSQPTTLYLADNAALAPETTDDAADQIDFDPRVGAAAGFQGGGPFNTNWTMPLDQRPDEVHSLVYTGQPLADALEVTGRPRVVLHFSSTARITLLTAKLCDVAPDGTSALVTKGYLNAAHRDAPAAPSYLEPGQIYEVEIEMLACAYRFREGHRLRLDIACADLLNIWPTPEPCTNTIYRGGARPSALVLPVRPPRDPSLPTPDLGVSPHPQPTREEMDAPQLSISRNPINDAATVHHEVAYSPTWTSAADYTVSARDPAHVVVRTTTRQQHDYPGEKIVVSVQCDTESDACTFVHKVDIAITRNGRPYFNKTWSATVPREFL